MNSRRPPIAGIVVIVVANAVALGGATYNRFGEPESMLQLTERELHLPYDWGRDRDNSGLALRLNWRVAGDEPDDIDRFSPYMFSRAPLWLDSAKLASLGFPMTRPADTSSGRAYYQKQLPRQVLLVLEMDGPASELVRARVREWATREQARVAASPNEPELVRQGQFASQQLLEEERDASRLFVIDAGRDRAALRALHPDRTRYAIVRGAVRPQVAGPDSAPRLEGSITDLAIDEINVPHRFRAVFESARPAVGRGRSTSPASRYTISVLFGRRLEPWITAAARRP